MWSLLLIGVQAIPIVGPVLTVPRPLRTATECRPAAADGDIVVCGRTESPYRLKKLPDRAEEPILPKAETTLIGNVKVAAETEAATMLGGAQSKRAMIRFKIPF